MQLSRRLGKNRFQSFGSLYKNDSRVLSSHLPWSYRNCSIMATLSDQYWLQNWTKMKVGEFYFGLHGEHLGEYVFTSHVFFTFILPPIMLEAGYFLPKKPFFENIGQVFKFDLSPYGGNELFWESLKNNFNLCCFWNDYKCNGHWFYFMGIPFGWCVWWFWSSRLRICHTE